MKYPILLLAIVVLASAAFAQTASNLPIDFTAVNMAGSKVDTRELRGKIVVLNLWFVNCPNCVDEIKVLNQLVDEYRLNKDVVFLAPAASQRTDLERFLIRNPFNYQVIPNASLIILSKFGTPDTNGEINMSLPMHFVLDREGRVVAKVQGVKGIEVVRAELRKQLMTVDGQQQIKGLP